MIKAIYISIVLVLLSGMMLMMVLLTLTPEKTSYNEYTQPYKYWTSNTYYCVNFIDHKYCGK